MEELEIKIPPSPFKSGLSTPMSEYYNVPQTKVKNLMQELSPFANKPIVQINQPQNNKLFEDNPLDKMFEMTYDTRGKQQQPLSQLFCTPQTKQMAYIPELYKNNSDKRQRSQFQRYFTTPIKDEDQSSESENRPSEEDDLYPTDSNDRTNKSFTIKSNRTQNKLKETSQKVRNIVQQEGVTTYKLVADRLISELTYQEKQNLKRRVYDALNVMVASQVLKKNGKTIHSNKNYSLEKQKQRDAILQQLEMKKNQNKAKRKFGDFLEQQFQNMGKLIQQNRQAVIVQDSTICFPFLICRVNRDPNDQQEPLVIFQKSQTHLTIKSNYPIVTVGDLDSLSVLKRIQSKVQLNQNMNEE